MPRSMNAADVHLGKLQYGSKERWNDFGRALAWLIDEAIRQKVCCLRISGDLFDSNTMHARTLLQATANLQRARDHGITVIIIPGNHDKPLYSDPFSWLDYLAEQELVMLLDPPFQDGSLILQPWDKRTLRGGYHDCASCHTRTVGVRHYGAKIAVVVEALTRALAAISTTDRPYTVLMLHAGLEGMLPHYSGGLTLAELHPLRRYVDCIALGHIHKPAGIDNWIVNPGSLETCSIDEAAWEDRGYWLLEIDPAQELVEFTSVPYSGRRSFLQFSFPVDGAKDPEQLYTDLRGCMTDEAMSRDRADSPVVELRLEGVLKFPRAALDIPEIERLLTDLFQPIVCQIRDLTETDQAEIVVSQSASRTELERQVLRGLVGRDLQKAEQLDGWVATLRELLDMALRGGAPEGIIEETQSHIDRIHFMEAEVTRDEINAAASAAILAGGETIDRQIMEGEQ